jgi:hypothetical protein
MSGVAGADRVKSRQDFQQFLKSYKGLVSQFPGFVSLNPSGSYNSNLEKNDFGDIDLIVHIQSDQDKATVKKQLQAFFMKQPETVIVPFSSAKHAGKRSYNAGELVSVRYHDDHLGYSAQIDNIVALDQKEAGFKQQFLDWPAEKQGLILGLIKIAAIETDPRILFKKLGIPDPGPLEEGQEYEFNLSSVELQLRRITYKPGTYEQLGREVLWNSRDFDDIQKLLYQYNLDADFDQLLAQAKQVIKNPRSNARMQGVFSSMITVKSGEVGTAKGAGKEAALAKIQNTFRESRNLLHALIESVNPGTIVFAFGRLQPPTIGHELLVNTVKQVAKQNGCPYIIYISKTVGKSPADKLKNPLTVDQKMMYLGKMFPGTHFAPATDQVRTPIEAAKYLNEKYQNLILVAGGSRAEEFDKLLNDYNGRDYNFNSIRVVKIDRDPDADDASGMSGTKMRHSAMADDFEAFKSGLPGALDDATAQQLMQDVKAGMTPTPKIKKTKEAMLPTSAFAGSKKNKLGPAGQWKNTGPSKNRPARAGDLVGGAAESIEQKKPEEKKKSWDDYGLPRGTGKTEPKEKVYRGWNDYEYSKKKEKEVAESNDIKGTLRTIATDIAEPITSLYETLKYMAKRYYDSHGDLKGFGMVAGGVGSRWFQTFYFNRLQNELYDLSKQNTKITVPLQQFLRGTEVKGKIESAKGFSAISKELPDILAEIGAKLNYAPLANNARRWIHNREEYEQYLSDLELSDYEDDDEIEKAPKVPKNPAMGQQRSQAEEIVNDVLKKLPSKIAGDIRNAIARAPNKLQALQQELQKRGVKVPMENMAGVGDMDNTEFNAVYEAKATKTRLDPSCWKGYHKAGTKVKGGTRVNNCVPNEAVNPAQQAAIAIAKKKKKGTTEADDIEHGYPMMATEHKKGVKAIKYTKKPKGIEAPKPRNFVAKNAVMGGAGAHKNKKKEAKHKHVAIGEAWEQEMTRAIRLLENK